MSSYFRLILFLGSSFEFLSVTIASANMEEVLILSFHLDYFIYILN